MTGRCGRCDRQRVLNRNGLCRRCVTELEPAPAADGGRLTGRHGPPTWQSRPGKGEPGTGSSATVQTSETSAPRLSASTHKRTPGRGRLHPAAAKAWLEHRQIAQHRRGPYNVVGRSG